MARIDEEKLSRISGIKDIGYFKERLLKSGYKLTKAREAIIKVLGKKGKLFDADSLYLEIKKENLEIGIATIYRTLELLSRLNIICRIVLGSEKTYYMLSKDCYKETFVYMVCNNCGKIITNNKCLNSSIKVRIVDGAEQNILKNCHLQINNYQVLFTGLCEECKVG